MSATSQGRLVRAASTQELFGSFKRDRVRVVVRRVTNATAGGLAALPGVASVELEDRDRDGDQATFVVRAQPGQIDMVQRAVTRFAVESDLTLVTNAPDDVTALEPARSGARGILATIAITIVASSAVLGLLVSGVAFLAVGVAFAIAVPIAQQYPVSFSAADLAVAARIAALWWIFVAISVASFLAAAVVVRKVIHHLDRGPGH